MTVEHDGHVKDPVCGMWIDPQKTAACVEHDRRTYYFCADACQKAFEKQPELYVSR